MALVTVEQVNNALRLDLQGDLGADPSADDGDASRLSDIELKISQAEGIVLDFLKNPASATYWSVEDDSVPGPVSAAVIIVIRCLLDDSEESTAMLSGLSGMTQPDPRNPVAALLWRLRDPALA